MAWLVRDDDVLATVELADTRARRRRGLLGRRELDGAFVIRPCRQVHTLGMRFALDVAFCDASGVVLTTRTLVPWRVSPFVWRSRLVVEAPAGASDRWGLRPGDVIELRG